MTVPMNSLKYFYSESPAVTEITGAISNRFQNDVAITFALVSHPPRIYCHHATRARDRLTV